jgi:hypothetical protein
MLIDPKHQWPKGSQEEIEDFVLFKRDSSELEKIGRKYNCDKSDVQTLVKRDYRVLIPGHNYLEIYESLFKKIRKRKISILEIGMGNYPTNGYSLQMWLEYFPKAEIHVADFLEENLGKFHFTFDSERCQFYLMDQSKEEDLNALVELVGENKFDIIIDDGSHEASDQLKSIKILFKTLKNDGMYFIEDIHKVEFYQHLPLFFESLNSGHLLDETVDREDIIQDIKEIQFFRSLVLVRKGIKKTR